MEKAAAVAAFVGIDAHSEPCSLKAVGRQGESLLTAEVATEEERLRAAVRRLPRPVGAMVEASSLGPLLKGWLERVVDRVIVCETRENRWIAKSEDKSDPADADAWRVFCGWGSFDRCTCRIGRARSGGSWCDCIGSRWGTRRG